MRSTGTMKGAEARGGGGGGGEGRGSDVADSVTDRSLLASHMHARTHTGRYTYKYVL